MSEYIIETNQITKAYLKLLKKQADTVSQEREPIICSFANRNRTRFWICLSAKPGQWIN